MSDLGLSGVAARVPGEKRRASALATLVLCLSAPGAFAYNYAKPITIDRTKIPGGCGPTTLANYPMLFSVTDPDLRHTTSLGKVTDLGGDDIIFKGLDATTCGGPPNCVLDHEIEKYVNTTGELVAWVRVPSVNTTGAASDTRIYMYYGDSAVMLPTENPTGVWNANFRGVWHLKEATGATAVDSTSNPNDATPVDNPVASTGQIGGALTFSAFPDRLTIAAHASLDLSSATTPNWTMSAWVRPTSYTGTDWAVIYSYGTWRASLNLSQVTAGADGRIENWTNDTTGLQGTTATTLNAWNHVTITRTAATTTFYLNGGADGSVATPAAVTPAGQVSGIGNDPIGPEALEQFQGLIDEVRVSNTARSACWIAASYNNEVWPNKAVTPSPDPTPNPTSGFYTIGAELATAVELLSFTAVGLDGAVELEWATGSEIDNLGFHLYRSLSEGGPFERITASLVPGLGSSPEGARYGYRDVGRANGVTYYYELEDVETTGRTERHGPVWALPRAGAAPPPGPVDEPPQGPGNGSGDKGEGASSWIRYGDPEATSLRVLGRGVGHVELELLTGGFWARPGEDGGVSLSIPGFEETQQPGAPALPVMRPWLEAVAGRKVMLVSVIGRDVVAFESLRPVVTGEPALWQAADGTLHAGQRRKRPAPAFQAVGLYPEEAAQVLGVAFQGDVKKAQLALSPLRFDRSAGRLLLARRLSLRVEFAGREKDEVGLGGSHGRKERGKKERRKKPRLAEGVVARLAVEAPGLYGVSYEEVFGARGRGVSAFNLSLRQKGEAVAFHVEPAGRRFGPGGMLYFVSAGAALNPYGKQAMYELSVGAGGVQMTVKSAAPQGGAEVPYYWQRVEQEVDSIYQASLLTSPERWLWDYVMSGTTKSCTFPVSALAMSSESSRLSVWLQGASDFPADPDHHVRVSVNGYLVGEASWDGKYPNRIEAEVPPGVLHEGENTLALENVGDTGAQSSLVLLDRYALSYPRGLVASGGALAGRFGPSGPGTAVVQGLGSAAFVLDTTQPAGTWLRGAFSGTAGLSFRAEPDHSYLAVSPEAMLRPGVSRASPSALRDTTNRADYLVLGPRAFLEAAQPLLEQRRAQGLETLGVAIEEVFDEFGFGEPRPEAVRDFLSHAYHHWALSPRYVLLLGDASYDFKDAKRTGVENHVPPYMIEDAYMWTVSDPAYASVNGDDLLPDLAVGRLPAQSVEQARALVEKVLAWENAGFDLSGRAVLVADNADSAGDFEGDAESLAQTFLAGRETQRIYLSQLGGATRTSIYEAFDGGSSLMSYMGHGAIALWASENVFNFGDVANLAPQVQQPFLMTINCLNGYFHYPFLNSLSEELVKAEGKGAIGAFAPSSLSVNWAARLYHEALVAEIASGRHERLGDALLAAQSAYADSGARPELLRTYQLLADPALRIR